ncbi:MAG: response regulator [Myxococcales bacterium]|nr:response regulator [Myxococcales bacterium]
MNPSKILLLSQQGRLEEKIRQILTEYHYDVQVCSDAKLAIETTFNFQPNLILCSAEMPVISGMELARLFKSHGSLNNIPFLLLSRKMPPVSDLERAGFRIAADEFIQLPIDQGDLLRAIGEWLSGQKTCRSLAERLEGPLTDAPQSRTSKPWYRGKITSASITRLFMHLIRHGESGVLRLKGERRILNVLLQSGAVVEVKSNYLRENTLGRYLEQINKLTQKENDDSLRYAKARNIQQGQALVQMGILDAKDLDYYLTQQQAQKILDVFTPLWKGSAFHFSGERLNPKRYKMEPVPLAEILKQGLMFEADPADLLESFQHNKKMDCILHKSDQYETIVNELRLDTDLQNYVPTLLGKSIQQLKETSSDKFENYLRLAFLLVISKALNFGETAKREELFDRFEGEPTTDVAIDVSDAMRDRFPSWDMEAYRTNLTEGRTFYNRNDFRGALHFLDKALAINPESSEALAMKAWCLYELSGKQNVTANFEAKEMLKQAITLDDTNDEAYLLLGRIFKAEGKDGLAGTYFKRSNDINPANEEARREVKLIQIKRRRHRDLGYRE